MMKLGKACAKNLTLENFIILSENNKTYFSIFFHFYSIFFYLIFRSPSPGAHDEVPARKVPCPWEHRGRAHEDEEL